MPQIVNRKKKKKWCRYFLKFGHNFGIWQLFGYILPGWLCSATCCRNDTAEAHRVVIWDFALSPVFFLSLNHRLRFFSIIWTLFLHRKTPRSEVEVETVFKDFLASKPFVYRTGTDNLVNRWHKCTGIIFWLIKTLFEFINPEIKV